MTQYKVGSKVLVRMTLDEGGGHFFRASTKNGMRGHINDNEIYSLVPEFNPGELIEVRSTEHEGWRKKYFVGWIPSARMPYFINLQRKPMSDRNFLRSWTEKQLIRYA